MELGTGNVNKNNWFGLETPLGGSMDFLQGHEERIKAFLCGNQEREIRFFVYLDNEESLIGVEDVENGRKGPIRKGKILLESWRLKYKPRMLENGSDEGEIRKLYKRTTLYIRSLLTLTKLLPSFSLLKQKLPFNIEISSEEEVPAATGLMESLTEEKGEKMFENVNETELSGLQTSHGDLEIRVQFRKLNGKFYSIVRSPAIRVPQQVIKAKDIQIKSGSPVTVGSGEWVDMSQQQQQSVKSVKKTATSATGQIKILTTAHKPSAPSSLSSEKQSKMDITEFIKIFEKVPELPETTYTATTSTPTSSQLIQILESGRSKKIVYDRWLEEMEIEHESLIRSGFDLISNME